ncbi:serine hydroxymethyltransferase, partial [Gluconacetobacter tumulisoli]|nr:serine hydroxymethyltransferase [Gluconacetobacter tumulisoli]
MSIAPIDPQRTDFFRSTLAERDPDVAAMIGGELVRQREGIELIASENMV